MSVLGDPDNESPYDGNDSWLARAVDGDEAAQRQLFARYHDRLKRMVHLRLDRRLRGRWDEDSVLQDACVDISRRLNEYHAEPKLPLFLWMRHIVGLKLSEVHRKHLGALKRDADLEVSLHRGAFPAANSITLAAQLMGSIRSPSEAVVKAEARILVQDALNA